MMSNADDAGRGLPPTDRTLCRAVKEATWYTDVITAQPDFSQRLALRPELEDLVHRVLSFERRIFTSHERVYAELRTLLDYKTPSSRTPAFATQVAQNGVGAAWVKFHKLMLYYRLFDRFWLYNAPPNLGIPTHSNKLLKNPFKGWHHIEDVQKLLEKFRTLCTGNSALTAGENGGTITLRPLFSTRLHKGSGIVQQLKDLAALHETTELVAIQRNLLLAALGLNWICQTKAENTQLDSSSAQVQPHADETTAPGDASENLQALMLYARHSKALSDAEMEHLENMLRVGQNDSRSKSESIHKNLLIALGITPLFLLVPVKLDRAQWTNISIYRASQELGNWRSELLVQIEKTIFDSIFDVAGGSMDAAQALVNIANNLPWKEINAMGAMDPDNVRFRCTNAASSQKQSVEESPSSVESSAMQQQTCNNAVPSIPRPLPLCASPSNTPPPPHPSPPQPPAPAPALPLQPAAAPLSATPATHTPAPPAALQPNDQGPERTDSGGNGGSALDTVNTTQLDEGNDDDGMDIDRRPTRATRARNQPSTSSIPPPMPRLESGNKGKQTKRKQHNTVADAEEPSESVPNSSSHSDERDIRRRLFPKKLPEIPEISLVVSKKTAVPKMMPARTLYCAKGRPHEIVFRAHSAVMFKFWRGTIDAAQRSYVDQKALHVVDQSRSIFSIVSHLVLKKMSITEQLKLLRRGPILETDRPTEPTSFDVEGLKLLGCSLSKVISIQDQSISPDQNEWGQHGTLQMMLECPAGKALNALSLPMPKGVHEAGHLSTDIVAWDEAARVAKNVDKNAVHPTEITRWGLCATAGASHTFHIDSDGFGTFVEVLAGVKIWVVLRTSKDSVADFSEFGENERYLKGTLNMNNPDEESCEAVVLTPGTRLYMRPNMMHAVYTSESAICHGGHFYASSTMKDTLCALIHAFAASRYVTNNTLDQSRLLLRQIIVFFAVELEHPSLDTKDPARHHLPKLNPLEYPSDNPEMNSIEAAEELFAACSLAIFMGVLHPATYLHPDVAMGGIPNRKQLQEMEEHDRNAMSFEERNACAGVRATAYKALKWFERNYRFVASNGQPPKLSCQEFLEEKLAEQAYAIYLAKAKAAGLGIEGYPGCSLDAVERQLRGTFPNESGVWDILERHFQNKTQLQYVHADFSGWKLEVITSPRCENDTASSTIPGTDSLDEWSELTPLDVKFAEGFSSGFKIDSGERPGKKRKVV